MKDDDIIDLIQLTVRLEKARPLPFTEAEQMRAAHSFQWKGEDSDLLEAKAHHEKHREKAYERVIEKIAIPENPDQCLAWNIHFLGFMLDDWFENGHSIRRHVPDRICVLLRKAKRLDLEFQFLRAFMPHYRTPYINEGNDKLIERAAKIDARWA